VSATGSLGWQTVYERRGLSPGVHTIQIRHGGGGGFIDVDAIEVFTPTIPAAVGVGVYDNAHPNWTYAGSWMDWAGQAGAHSQTLSMTSDTSATATIQINGTAFRLRYTRFTNRGSLLIFVDGVLVASQSAAGTLNWQTVLTWSGLTNGVHTIVIRHNGPPGSFIDVDAIDVL
jgi:hypothetical protein